MIKKRKIIYALLILFLIVFTGCKNSNPHSHIYVNGKCECGEIDNNQSEEVFYTVVFKDYDGTELKIQKVKHGCGAVSPAIPSRDGYTFIGWDKDFSNVKSDMEIYAYYEKNVEKVESAQEWLDNIKFGINYMHGIRENNDNDGYFNWIKNEGFNAVEIGCYYADLVESIYGDLNTESFEKLKSIIDTAYKYDLYIILSLYDGNDYKWTNLNYSNKESILKMINTSYKNLVIALNEYDDKLAISFCSEPRDHSDGLVDIEDCEVLNEVNKAFVEMVRSTGGNNVTRKLVITTGWSKCDGIPAKKFQMVEDDYTMVRIHLYKPSGFSGSKTTDEIWLDKEYKLVLLQCFQEMKENFTDLGIPIYIGEFGARPKNNDLERNKWAKCFLSLANSYNIKCFIWDTENKGSGIANSYAISNKEQLVWLNPDFMNYVLELIDDNYVPFYDTYNKKMDISEEIVIPHEITNLITKEKEEVDIIYDVNKIIMINGKYYAKESGIITFSYTLNGYNYYYQYEVIGTNEESKFEIKIKIESSGKIQCVIATPDFSQSRLDYEWTSTNTNVLMISKYSTITILSDGECSIIAKNKITGDIGIIDVTIINGEISSATSRNSSK